jgi:hypothetical protein
VPSPHDCLSNRRKSSFSRRFVRSNSTGVGLLFVLQFTAGFLRPRQVAQAAIPGLLLPVQRKSVEPMAAHLAPERVRSEHQRLHHFAYAARNCEPVAQALLRRTAAGARGSGAPRPATVFFPQTWSSKSRLWPVSRRRRWARRCRASVWAEVAKQARQLGLVASISGSTVWRWLNADAIRPWRHRCWIFPRDPQFAFKAGRLLDL